MCRGVRLSVPRSILAGRGVRSEVVIGGHHPATGSPALAGGVKA